MKKIILFLITFFISFSSLFAATSIDISTNNSVINSWDIFEVTLEIITDKESNIEITEISGIENFDIISQNQSSQIQIINGEVNSIQWLKIWLRTTNSGIYLLWPAKIKIWEEEFTSNQLELTINDFTVPTLSEKKSQENNNISENENLEENILDKDNSASEKIEDTENISTVNNNLEKNNSEDKTLNTEKNWNNNSKLADIHTVKKLNMSLNIFEYTGVIYFWLFIIFITIFYLFLIKILDNKKISKLNKKIESDKILARQEEIKNIYDELLELSKTPENYSQVDFYTELNILFRRYFLYIWIDLADKKTLAELRKDTIDNKILDIFSKSYMYEFSTQEDTLSDRKQIIMNFMIFLKK